MDSDITQEKGDEKMRRKYPMNEWGLMVTNFRLRHAMTLTELCRNAGISTASFHAVAAGKHSGKKTKFQIDTYMTHYEASA